MYGYGCKRGIFTKFQAVLAIYMVLVGKLLRIGPSSILNSGINCIFAVLFAKADTKLFENEEFKP